MRHRIKGQTHSDVNLLLKLNILLASPTCETYKRLICIENVILQEFIFEFILRSFGILLISVILRDFLSTYVKHVRFDSSSAAALSLVRHGYPSSPPLVESNVSSPGVVYCVVSARNI